MQLKSLSANHLMSKKVSEFLALIESDGYLGLVEWDASVFNSVYIRLHLPPKSLDRQPIRTRHVFRISDHPPRSDKIPWLVGSWHNNDVGLRTLWRQAKVVINRHMASVREAQQTKRDNVTLHAKQLERVKQYRKAKRRRL